MRLIVYLLVAAAMWTFCPVETGQTTVYVGYIVLLVRHLLTSCRLLSKVEADLALEHTNSSQVTEFVPNRSRITLTQSAQISASVRMPPSMDLSLSEGSISACKGGRKRRVGLGRRGFIAFKVDT